MKILSVKTFSFIFSVPVTGLGSSTHKLILILPSDIQDPIVVIAGVAMG